MATLTLGNVALDAAWQLQYQRFDVSRGSNGTRFRHVWTAGLVAISSVPSWGNNQLNTSPDRRS
jgi:hypothetical protein